MKDAVRHRLYTLQRSCDYTSLETYCKELLIGEDDVFVRGCLLWNLSDVYAMRREANALYENHRRFETHIQTMLPQYRLWLVSDATQRLTLEIGGFGDVWQSWYIEATQQFDPACEAALFESHRAAFYKSRKMPYDRKRALWVKDRFSSFLEFARHSPSTPYYRLVYTALCLKHFGEAEYDVAACCEPFFAALRYSDEESIYVAGEWQAINCQRSRQVQAQVGLNNIVNALLDIGAVNRARELYRLARQHGLASNSFIEKQL